ncbi:MAG TPA: hypothetical protein VF252_02680 [Gemmatimonadales bacterium]
MRSWNAWFLAGLALFLGSCTYWEPYAPLASTGPSPDLPSSLQVVSDTGSPLLLTEPFVRADTLFGRTGRDTVRLPLHQLREVQRQRVHGLRTLGLIAGVGAVWITVGLYGGGLE